MNKENAKEYIEYIVGRLKLASKLDDPLTGNQKAALVRNLQATVDAIEVEHKPVVLPQKVGEQWYKLVGFYRSYQPMGNDWSAVNYALNRIPNIDSPDTEYRELVNWWINTKDSYTQLVDAARYGWKPKPEKHFVLPMDGTLEEHDDNEGYQYYASCYNGRWETDEVETDPSYKHLTVTQSELDNAPAWVKAIKPVEVENEG